MGLFRNFARRQQLAGPQDLANCRGQQALESTVPDSIPHLIDSRSQFSRALGVHSSASGKAVSAYLHSCPTEHAVNKSNPLRAKARAVESVVHQRFPLARHTSRGEKRIVAEPQQHVREDSVDATIQHGRSHVHAPLHGRVAGHHPITARVLPEHAAQVVWDASAQRAWSRRAVLGLAVTAQHRLILSPSRRLAVSPSHCWHLLGAQAPRAHLLC